MHTKEVWVRVVGLPLRLWCQEIFRKIIDGCGGFVAIDEEIARLRHLQWVGVLVYSNGSVTLGSMQVVEDGVVCAIQLWWEVPPWPLLWS